MNLYQTIEAHSKIDTNIITLDMLQAVIKTYRGRILPSVVGGALNIQLGDVAVILATGPNWGILKNDDQDELVYILTHAKNKLQTQFTVNPLTHKLARTAYNLL